MSDNEFEYVDEDEEVDEPVAKPRSATDAYQQNIQTVSSVLCIPPPSAAILLRCVHPDPAQIVLKWSESLAKSLGLALTPDQCGARPATEPFFCETCMETRDAGCALHCGHMFCDACWGSAVTLAAGSTAILTLRCPQAGCRVVVPDDVLMRYVRSDRQQALQTWILKAMADTTAGWAQCPLGGCTNTVRVPADPQQVTCPCGHVFCGLCAAAVHVPASCVSMAAWNDRATRVMTAGNDTWEKEHVRTCPGCSQRIFRDGGCNHMTCRKEHGGCGHEFCWMCLAPWKGHGGSFYSCNVFEERGALGQLEGEALSAFQVRAAAAKAKTDMERFEFYAGRVNNAKRAADIAARHPVPGEATVAGTLVIQHALTEIVTGRTVLAYTYIEGYFMDERSDPRLVLFRHLQSQLEIHTEQLQSLVESWRSGDCFYQIQLYTAMAAEFRTKVCLGVQDGL